MLAHGVSTYKPDIRGTVGEGALSNEHARGEGGRISHPILTHLSVDLAIPVTAWASKRLQLLVALVPAAFGNQATAQVSACRFRSFAPADAAGLPGDRLGAIIDGDDLVLSITWNPLQTV